MSDYDLVKDMYMNESALAIPGYAQAALKPCVVAEVRITDLEVEE